MLPVDKIVSEIELSLPVFSSKLGEKAPYISKSILYLENLYRWHYYIERISMLAERSMSDTNLDINAIIINFVEVFNKFEEKTKKRQ